MHNALLSRGRLRFYSADAITHTSRTRCSKRPIRHGKIKVTNPVVELDGDEMTGSSGNTSRKADHPFLDINLMYFDLGMEYRDKTNDQVTLTPQRHQEGRVASNAPPSRRTKPG